jgi:hypothetical protein
MQFSTIQNISSHRQYSQHWESYLLFLLLAVFIVIRLMAARGQLWMDEIWSLNFAQQAESIWDIFTFKHDNNHILNTIFLYLAGPEKPSLELRIFSICAGAGLILLVWQILKDASRAERFAAIVLIGFSYPLCVYSSEARGYSPAIFFAMLAFWLARRYLIEHNFRFAIGFWLASVFGLLSHLTYIYAYLSMVIWSILFLSEIFRNDPRKILKTAILMHFVPILVCIAFYLLFVSGMFKASADVFNPFLVVQKSLPMVIGLDAFRPPNAVSILLFFAIFISGLYVMAKSHSIHDWLFYLLVIFFAPLMILIYSAPDNLRFRYYIISLPFFYLLFAFVVGRLFHAGKMGKILYGAILLTFVIGNMNLNLKLIELGRGQFREALQYIVKNTDKEQITLGSDSDFRTKMVLAHYMNEDPELKRLHYIAIDKWPAEGVDWALIMAEDTDFIPPVQISGNRGNTYELRHKFLHSGLSGWSWYLYRKYNENNENAGYDVKD